MLFLNLGWRRHVCRSVFDSLLERGVVFREATSDELEASLPYLVQIPDSQSQYVVQSRLIWNALRSRLIAPPLRLCLKQSSIGIWETLSDSVSQVSWDQLLLLGASVYFGVWAFLQLVDRKGPTEAASDAVSIAIPLWAILGLVYVVVKILRKKD